MPRPQKGKRKESNVADPSRYPVEVFYSEDDGGFIAITKDLPGCSAFGKTQTKAIAEIQDAIKAWQQAAIAAGNLVPEPSRHEDDILPSGKILLRIPRSLHASLIECARSKSVSLNQHLVSVLSFSVGTTLLRDALAAASSMQTLISSVGMIPSVVGTGVVRGYQFAIGSTENVVGPGQLLDVKTLKAGEPIVVIEGR